MLKLEEDTFSASGLYRKFCLGLNLKRFFNLLNGIRFNLFTFIAAPEYFTELLFDYVFKIVCEK